METMIRTLGDGTKAISAEALQALRGTFRGPVLHRGDAGYEEARLVWNGMIDRQPALIVRCTGTADVCAAIAFVREHGLMSSVKGGGHNIAGLAICDGGVVIDMSLMRGVWVDVAARSAHAQAGCLLADVDRETQLHGLAAVLGFVSATGIAGLTTGGGYGYLTRRFGWTCDNVISMEVVMANGQVLRASESQNPELFWCLRGGSGNFGIVTSFEYRLHPVGPLVMGGAVAWRAEDAPQVLRFFREFSAAAPRELTCVALMRIAPPAPWLPREIHGKPMVAVFACHSGNADEAARAVAPLKAFGKPVADILVPRPYTQLQSLLDATQPKGRRYYWKSEYLGALQPAALDTMVAQAAQVPSPHSAMILFQIGGALNDLPAGHSPAGNRDAMFNCNIASAWDSAADDDVNIAWTRAAWQAMKPFSTGGAYLNFMTEDEGADRVLAAYGEPALARLAAMKLKYDPHNLFRHTKSLSGG